MLLFSAPMARIDLFLRAAMERAKGREPAQLTRTRAARDLVTQRANAAEALWAGGHAAEGLRLAKEAYQAAVDAIASVRGLSTPDTLAPDTLAPEDGSDPSDGSAENQPAEQKLESAGTAGRSATLVAAGIRLADVTAAEVAFERPSPVLDDEVSFADSAHYKALLRVAHQTTRRLFEETRTPANVRASQLRRLVAGTTLLVSLLAALGLWIRARSIEANAAWIARYYPRTNFAGDAERTHVPEIDFDWGATSPMMAIPSDHFSARFDACLEVEEAQTIRVGLGSDDGSRVFIDGVSVVNNWRAQAYTWKDGELQLEAGRHHIRVEYFEGGGNAKLQLQLHSGDAEFNGTLSRPTAPDEGCGELAAARAPGVDAAEDVPEDVADQLRAGDRRNDGDGEDGNDEDGEADGDDDETGDEEGEADGEEDADESTDDPGTNEEAAPPHREDDEGSE